MRIIRAIAGWIGLMLLCSCATHSPVPPGLPAEVSFNDTVDYGLPMIVTLTLADGEKLPFFVDTGCSGSTLDKSVEPKLGKRLGSSVNRWAFYNNRPGGIYATPALYLGQARLLTGKRIKTDDFSGADYGGIKIKGMLGMDCLRHYCVQMDFTAHQLRLLDPRQLNTNDLGQPFPLNIWFGCVLTHADMLDMKKLWFRVDSGLYGGLDFLLWPSLYQWELLEQKPFGQWQTANGKGDALYSTATFGGNTYTNFVLKVNGAVLGNALPTQGADFTRLEFGGESYTNVVVFQSVRTTWPVENLIGLDFLSRHLVTFDFPHRTMYLKRTSLTHPSGTNNYTLVPLNLNAPHSESPAR